MRASPIMPAVQTPDRRDSSPRFMLSASLADGVGANLPMPLTLLIARDQELAAVETLLRDGEVRLLTFTGPGGVGKTRLAIAAATDAVEDFPDGVAFINLAPIADANLVLTTIAGRLGLRDMGIESLPDRLINVLTDRRLVLDNFEQVVAAGPQLRDLLGACPGVTLLITSRLRLRLSGEREFPVSPLPLPLQVTPQLRLRMPGYPARFGSLPSGGREPYGPSPHYRARQSSRPTWSGSTPDRCRWPTCVTPWSLPPPRRLPNDPRRTAWVGTRSPTPKSRSSDGVLRGQRVQDACVPRGHADTIQQGRTILSWVAAQWLFGGAEKGVLPMEQLRSSRSIVVGAIVVGVFVVLGVAALAQNNSGLSQLYSAPPVVQTQAQDAAPSAQTPDGTAVKIVDFAFQPDSLQIAAGTTETWTNTGVPHTVTSDTGAFDSGVLNSGASFSQTFDTPGTFTYHCQIHPFMTATIVVS